MVVVSTNHWSNQADKYLVFCPLQLRVLLWYYHCALIGSHQRISISSGNQHSHRAKINMLWLVRVKLRNVGAWGAVYSFVWLVFLKTNGNGFSPHKKVSWQPSWQQKSSCQKLGMDDGIDHLIIALFHSFSLKHLVDHWSDAIWLFLCSSLRTQLCL